MIRIDNPKDCCGCSACSSVCATDAISMQPDALGFLYPKVDEDKCINCGLCENVCAFNSCYDVSLNFPVPYAYGARHKNMDEVATSRSGAAFIALSDWILERGGVVYGVGYAEHFRVIHKRATTKELRNEFKGSKYVQSDLNGVFRRIKKDLQEGVMVLFSGTPCQTAGLNSYVGKRLRDNLFLVDLICHGVPSPYIWKDYVSCMEQKHKSEIVKFDFRDKTLFGWTAHKESFRFHNGMMMSNEWYTKMFHQHIMLRHSCGCCHYTNTQRPSDITIADFWGWEKTNQEINVDDKGLNLVLINTKKGQDLWNSVQNDMFCFSAKLEDCMQPNLQKPTRIHRYRMKFEKDYSEKGFEYIYQHRYTPIVLRLKRSVNRLFVRLKKSTKKVVKK